MIREQTDSGTPTVVADPKSGAHAQKYHETAQRLAAALATEGKDYSRTLPQHRR